MNKFICALTLIFPSFCMAETVKIAALGDSLTQGFGLREELGFVPQLQAWLTERGANVQLVNAGVSGDTTAGGAARVAWTLTPDVDGMIVALGGNDVLRGIAPEVARENIASILETAQGAHIDVLLVGMQAPGNFGPEYKAAFDGFYSELAEEYGVLLLESFFAGLPSQDPAALADLFQADGIHPNAAGVGLIVEAFGPVVLELVAQIEGS